MLFNCIDDDWEAHKEAFHKFKKDYQRLLRDSPEIVDKYYEKNGIGEIYRGFEQVMSANDVYKEFRDGSFSFIRDFQEATIGFNGFKEQWNQFVDSLESREISSLSIGDDHPSFPLFTEEEKEEFIKKPLSFELDFIKSQLAQALKYPKEMAKPKTVYVCINDKLDPNNTIIGGISAENYPFNLAQDTIQRNREKQGPFIDDPEIAKMLFTSMNQAVEEIAKLPLYRLFT